MSTGPDMLRKESNFGSVTDSEYFCSHTPPVVALAEKLRLKKIIFVTRGRSKLKTMLCIAVWGRYYNVRAEFTIFQMHIHMRKYIRLYTFRYVAIYRDLGQFLSPPFLSQVLWQITWPRLRSQVTCGVFCVCFIKWHHKSLGPKSLGLFWNAPYCFPTDALLTSPCITVNTIVTSRVNTIVTSLNAAQSQTTMPTMLSQPMASHP